MAGPTGRVHVIDHPLVQHKLTLMRSKETSTSKFRTLLREISTLLAYEVCRDFPTTNVEVETPIAKTMAPMLDGKKLVLISILRAGNGLLDGMLDLIPSARVGHIGLYRDHETLEPVDYYFKIPADAGERDFLLLDPMLATGGSAIAAVGPITNASDEEMAIALGTVFVLNSVALLIFPSIGAVLKLTQSQFGLWAALAIHDTSSVVGAAAKYGAEALAIATTVKLARALWIVPLSVATAVVRGAKAKIQWTWYIGLFCLAAVCNTYLPAGAHAYGIAVKVAKIGLTATLFLIGSGISVATIKRVGHRPLLQGVVLWLLVSVGSLWLIRAGWIAL